MCACGMMHILYAYPAEGQEQYKNRHLCIFMFGICTYVCRPLTGRVREYQKAKKKKDFLQINS